LLPVHRKPSSLFENVFSICDTQTQNTKTENTTKDNWSIWSGPLKVLPLSMDQIFLMHFPYSTHTIHPYIMRYTLELDSRSGSSVKYVYVLKSLGFLLHKLFQKQRWSLKNMLICQVLAIVFLSILFIQLHVWLRDKAKQISPKMSLIMIWWRKKHELPLVFFLTPNVVVLQQIIINTRLRFSDQKLNLSIAFTNWCFQLYLQYGHFWVHNLL
jgi:hypothetical protein